MKYRRFLVPEVNGGYPTVCVPVTGWVLASVTLLGPQTDLLRGFQVVLVAHDAVELPPVEVA